MNPELEQFKKKIETYSIVQLEEIVMSIDKHKYPEKLAVVRDVLILKKLEIPSETVGSVQDKTESSLVPEASTQPLPNAAELVPLKAETTPPKTNRSAEREKPLSSKSSQWLFWLLCGFAALTSVISVYFIILPQTKWAGKDLWVRVGSEITGISLTESKPVEVTESQTAEPVTDDTEPSDEGS